MKKRILLFTAIVGFGYLIFSSHAAGPARSGYDCTGAEAGGTGNYANPTGCSTGGGCHNTSATGTISVAIVFDSVGVPTTHYKAGKTYTVKITGTNSGASLPKYGFQLAAMKGNTIATTETDAGTWATTGLPASTHISSPTAYTYLTVAEHSSAIALVGSSFTDSFSWTAPVAGTGTISFWAAANFVNGNTGADAGDLWNTNHIVINEWSSVSVANVSTDISVKAYPNPVTTNLNVQFDNAQEGAYSLQVFDLNGRMVTNENIVVNGTSQATNINTANWALGMYQVVLQKDGFSKTISVVKR